MVRASLEWPEDNLRKLMWHRNPNHEITHTQKKGPFTRKTLIRMVTTGTLTKQWILPLVNTKGEQASYHLGPSLPRGREAGMWQPESEGKGLLQSRPQKLHLPPNCEQAASSKLHLPRILGSSYMKQCHSLRLALQRRHTTHLGLWLCGHPGNQVAGTRVVHQIHSPPGTVHLPSTQSPEWLGPGKGAKHTAHLGLCHGRAPENLSSLDLGSAQNAGPTWDTALAEHPEAWAVWIWEVEAALGCGKSSVVHPLQALPTHASGIGLQCPSLSTGHLKKWV